MTEIVSIIGTDGSGKTTLSAALAEELCSVGIDARHEWLGAESYLMAPVRRLLRIFWHRGEPNATGSTDYAAEIRSKNKAVNRFKWAERPYVWLVLFDYRLQLWRKMRRNRRRSVVVADRYLFDVVVNLGLTLGWSPEETIQFAQRKLAHFKLPAVRVFLRVPPEISMQRKDDIPDIDYLRLRFKYYESIARAFGFVELDGTDPIDQNCRELVLQARRELSRPYVHYVHSNNVDVGGADKVLVSMAKHMREYDENGTGGFRTAVSLRLPTQAAASHASVGTAVGVANFVRPQTSSGLRSLVVFALRAPAAFAFFLRRFRREQPDLVHVNDLYDFIPAGAAKTLGIPVVFHIRMFKSGRSGRMLIRLVEKLATMIVPVSEAVARQFSSGNVRVIHDLGDPRLASQDLDFSVPFLRPAGVGSGGRLVTMVGRIEGWKGQLVFLEAVSKLTEETRIANTFILVGGRVPSKDDYFELVAGKAAELGVQVLGARDDVAEILRATDVSVHCSTEPDPFPGVVIESMLAGAATIGSDAGGVPEIIGSDGAGILISPSDAEALAGQLRSLLQPDRDPRAEFGTRGRVRALQLIDPGPIDAELGATYRELIAAANERNV